MVGITRTDILNHLADTYGLKRYLEIGVQNPAQNFDKIRCEYKVCVDPDPAAHATFVETSDEFFQRWITDDGKSFFNPFDLIFIDGLHHSEQVIKDLMNAIRCISSGGFIVLHDCNPQKEEHTIVPRLKPTGHWNGDCYKVAAQIPFRKSTVDEDNGCCVVRPFEISLPHPATVALAAAAVGAIVGLFNGMNNGESGITWEKFDSNRKKLLNLITWDEFKLQFTRPHI